MTLSRYYSYSNTNAISRGFTVAQDLTDYFLSANKVMRLIVRSSDITDNCMSRVLRQLLRATKMPI